MGARNVVPDVHVGRRSGPAAGAAQVRAMEPGDDPTRIGRCLGGGSVPTDCGASTLAPQQRLLHIAYHHDPERSDDGTKRPTQRSEARTKALGIASQTWLVSPRIRAGNTSWPVSHKLVAINVGNELVRSPNAAVEQ